MNSNNNYLTDLAARLQAELEGVKRGAAHAVAAGELLVEAKALVAHGEWADWCRSAGISPRTANHYMRLSRHRSAFELANLADLTVTFALATLAPPKPDPPPAPRPKVAGLIGNTCAAPLGYKAATAYLAAQGYPVQGGLMEAPVSVPSFGLEYIGAQGVLKLAAAVRGGAKPDPVLLVVHRMAELGVSLEQLIRHFERERATLKNGETDE